MSGITNNSHLVYLRDALVYVQGIIDARISDESERRFISETIKAARDCSLGEDGSPEEMYLFTPRDLPIGVPVWDKSIEAAR